MTSRGRRGRGRGRGRRRGRRRERRRGRGGGGRRDDIDRGKGGPAERGRMSFDVRRLGWIIHEQTPSYIRVILPKIER